MEIIANNSYVGRLACLASDKINTVKKSGFKEIFTMI